jgi:hypothetical protein
MSHVCDGRDLSCASCAAVGRRLASVRAAMTVDDRLDDIKRARIWTALEDRLGDAAGRRRGGWPMAIGVAAALGVAAAAGVLVVRSPRSEEPRLLAVPVDTTVSSRLGPHTAASIVGPAQLDIVGPTGDATAVRLHSGTLLAEFTGGPHRSLRIEAPGAVIEVVGTLFAVEVRGGTTCTSVAHGRVRVTTLAAVVEVDGGQRHCTGGAFAPMAPISDDMRDALARQGAAAERRAETATQATEGSSPSAASPAAVAPPAAAVPSDLANTSDLDPAPAARAGSRSATALAQSPGGPRSPAPVVAPAGSRSPTTRVQSLGGRPSPAPIGAPAGSRSTTAPVQPPGGPRSSSPVTTSAPPAVVPPVAPLASPRRSAAQDTSSNWPGRGSPLGGSPEPRPAPAVSSTASLPAPAPDELYRRAEAALAARDLGAADRALATLIAEYPDARLVDQALYERARIAYQQRAWSAARGHLARLAAIPNTPLAEPGHYLRCRIAALTRDASAVTCLTGFRAAFPRSTHDLDVLALLVQRAHEAAGCAGAARLVDELAQSYPRTTLAAAWRTRCPEPR